MDSNNVTCKVHVKGKQEIHNFYLKNYTKNLKQTSHKTKEDSIKN